MSIVAKKGDLFTIPLSAASFGVGVVAGRWKSELYLVLFRELFENTEKVVKVALEELTPLLASSSLDAKIWHGHWPIIRSAVDTSSIAQPIYKIKEPDGLMAESFDRKLRTTIGRQVAQQLNYRKGVAPVRLENALKAYHGLGQWDPIFEELSYALVVKSNEILNHA